VLFVLLLPLKSCVLFPASNEFAKITSVGESRNKRVIVIGHDAVRENFKPETGCRSQQVRDDLATGVNVSENRTPSPDADRQEIVVLPSIVETVDSGETIGGHTRTGASTLPGGPEGPPLLRSVLNACFPAGLKARRSCGLYGVAFTTVGAAGLSTRRL
jgi:hypothetical protein